ncbi:MAG: hypothetical protein ACREFQ_13290 [Stellaceae bacterium]
MLGSVRKSADTRAALARIENWTRRRFGLQAEDTVLVTEIACGLPGCPPIETVVAFWCGGERHQFKLFKRALEATEDDLPPAFFKDALAASMPVECC